jgi:hypothetical protein
LRRFPTALNVYLVADLRHNEREGFDRGQRLSETDSSVGGRPLVWRYGFVVSHLSAQNAEEWGTPSYADACVYTGCPDEAPRLRTGQEVPGFAVLFPAGAFAGDVGIEAEAGGVLENLDGQDVPDVERDAVGHQDVDIFGGVSDFTFSVDAVDGLDVVASGAQDFGAFQLYAPEAGAGIRG